MAPSATAEVPEFGTQFPAITGLMPADIDVQTAVNDRRVGGGCAPVSIDGALNRLAQEKAIDQARSGVMSHNWSDGSDPSVHFAAHGIGGQLAENVAVGQPSAAIVVNDWMNSPAHRENIMDCGLSRIGVGLAHSATGTPFWALEFAS